MRKYLAGIWLLFLTIAAGTIFWYTSWQYNTSVRRGKFSQLATTPAWARTLCGFYPSANQKSQ